MNLMHRITGCFGQLGKKLRSDSRFASIFYCSMAAVVVILIVPLVVSCGKKGTDETQEGEVTTQETQEDAQQNVALPDYTVKDVALEENAYADVNEFVNRYFTAMTNGDTQTIQTMQNDSQQKELLKIEKESAYIDEFDNLKVYTKPGPLTPSYITFVYYEIKFSGIETLAPGLTTLYICSNEDGSLYINSLLSDQDTEFIRQIVAQDDVVDLFSLVETKYAEAVDADANLKSFMEGLSAKLDAEVSEAMAAIEAENAAPEETAEPAEEESTSPENVVAEQVMATDTVNVRSSDSENADRIGQIGLGTTITRYEKKENGWSRVDYNGTEGYIKSEYLEPISNGDTAQAGTETEASEATEETTQETATQETTQTGSLAGKSKVTIKETVNVGKSASQDSDKLGVAYQGENYDLIMEQADGWCKIKFNGETGYVKTEFVE